MSVEQVALRKNGEACVDSVRAWVHCDASGSDCWGYMNPDWQAPIGRLDPAGDSEASYELVRPGGGVVPVRLWDHREEAFIQVNQPGYRTVRFETPT